jgi:hypothetical protein
MIVLVAQLAADAARWAAANGLADVDDRAADNWRQLLAIANVAGASRGLRARIAAVALSNIEQVLLLVDIRILAFVASLFGRPRSQIGPDGASAVG